jgi:hypothetical protein
MSCVTHVNRRYARAPARSGSGREASRFGHSARPRLVGREISEYLLAVVLLVGLAELGPGPVPPSRYSGRAQISLSRARLVCPGCGPGRSRPRSATTGTPADRKPLCERLITSAAAVVRLQNCDWRRRLTHALSLPPPAWQCRIGLCSRSSVTGQAAGDFTRTWPCSPPGRDGAGRGGCQQLVRGHLAARRAGRRLRPRLVLPVAGGGPDDHGRPWLAGPGTRGAAGPPRPGRQHRRPGGTAL